MRPSERFATGALLAGREDTGQDAIKLFDREILADVAVGPGAQGGVHPLLVVTDAGEDDNRKILAHFPDEGDQRDSIHFRHVEVDHDHVALIVFEPGRSLKSLGEELAGVTFLLEVGDEKFGDGGVIIDEEEFGGVAGEYFHGRLCYNYYNQYKH